MTFRVWAAVAGVIALAAITAGFLFAVQVLGPHARRPRYGAAAAYLGRPTTRYVSSQGPP